MNPAVKGKIPAKRGIRQYTLSWWIELAGICLLGLLWLAVIQMVQQDHEDERRSVLKMQSASTKAMEIQIKDVLDDADNVLRLMKSSQETSGDISKEIRQVLEMSNLSRFASQASILDTKGQFVFSFRTVAPSVNLADRAQFRAHIERDTKTFFIGPVVFGRVSGTNSFHMSRRINNADGSFGGVVSLAFQSDYFSDVFEKVTIEPMTFYLFGRDGIIRATSADSTAMLGKSLAAGHVLRAMETEPTHGGFIAEGIFRNARRFISYREIPDYPLIIAVAIDENVALARHRIRRNIYSGVALLVSVMLTVMLAGLHQSLKKQEKMRLSIWSEKEKAEKYLDMAGSLIVARDRESRITMINHKGCEILGYSEKELLGKDWIEVVVPQEQRSSDKANFQQLVTGALLPAAHPVDVAVQDRNGNLHILSWTSNLLQDSDGQIMGILSSGTEVTERRQLEAELKILATTDSLTGLNNRRHLLETGSRMMQSFRRYQRPLALLMLDIDHFKKINDTYGHAAGDLVLVQLADVLRSVLRAADLCGRFGGEEFVCLLPETSVSEALILAERLRARLAEQAVCSEAGAILFTVSIGVSVAMPEDISIDQLIHRADMALYEAKKSGRNRICLQTEDE